jgi:hypothetical protein
VALPFGGGLLPEDGKKAGGARSTIFRRQTLKRPAAEKPSPLKDPDCQLQFCHS